MEAEFYLDFENNFRGSRNQIRDILSNYDGLIQYVLDTDDHPRLLDIGSGRGEWLQKCSDLGFESIGIEINSDMAEFCENIGLNILRGDAISLLKDIPDNSFSLISAFHIIEHIDFDSINTLCIECKRILKDNGLLILETPSIDNLSISSRFFHIDPTHINPINPDLLAFTLGRIGYNMVRIFYLNGGPLQDEDKYSLTRIFNGVAQDLSLIATKSKATTLKLNNNKSWEQSLKFGLTTIDAAVEFDHQLRLSLVNNEEEIRSLRSRIYKLEILLNTPIYKCMIILSQDIEKKIIKMIKIYKILMQWLKKILRFNLIFLYNFLQKILSKNMIIFYLICKSFDKITRCWGYRFKYGKLIKMSQKPKEDLQSIYADERKLDLHYNRFIRPKNIFNKLK